jgi:hypothetical protein
VKKPDPILRKVGKFVVPNEYLYCHPRKLKKFLGRMIIVRCEQCYDIDGIRYTALCDDFRHIEPAFHPPDYSLFADSKHNLSFMPQKPPLGDQK